MNAFPSTNSISPIVSQTLKPSISIVGLGYVGAVSTACLADLGHHVIGTDVDKEKVDQIGRGHSPIHEQGLGELLSSGVHRGTIQTSESGMRFWKVLETESPFILESLKLQGCWIYVSGPPHVPKSYFR